MNDKIADELKTIMSNEFPNVNLQTRNFLVYMLLDPRHLEPFTKRVNSMIQSDPGLEQREGGKEKLLFKLLVSTLYEICEDADYLKEIESIILDLKLKRAEQAKSESKIAFKK